ncbi:hypothetical protein GCM10020229_38610 [Kitasatospora albolonga]|uniref:SHOCT domain-containing protein n=1 Tax=Kitasatospora albolonga TaxID=68173 RepID=UPI0031EA1289
MRYWNDHGMNGWAIGLMTVSMVLVLGLIIVVGLALVRRLDRTPQQHPGALPTHTAPPDPEQLLAERYAKGEIDTDEYRHRLETLRQEQRPGSGSERT